MPWDALKYKSRILAFATTQLIVRTGIKQSVMSFFP